MVATLDLLPWTAGRQPGMGATPMQIQISKLLAASLHVNHLARKHVFPRTGLPLFIVALTFQRAAVVRPMPAQIAENSAAAHPLPSGSDLCVRQSGPRSRLDGQWMSRLGFEREALSEHVLTLITEAERIFADETMLPTLGPSDDRCANAVTPFGGRGGGM